jgi:hypothetical protein
MSVIISNNSYFDTLNYSIGYFSARGVSTSRMFIICDCSYTLNDLFKLDNFLQDIDLWF